MHRTLTTLLLLAAPVVAAAQTPADIARQVWPYGPPASADVTPHGDAGLRTGATSADLARLAGPLDGAGDGAVTPPSSAALAYGFTPADLARLRGDGTLPSELFLARSPSRVVVSR